MWNYLQDIEELYQHQYLIDPKNFSYITNKKYYDPSCHESLHDSWLISFKIKAENVNDLLQRKFYCPNIELSLLGAYHDLIININYNEVYNYFVHGDNNLSDILFHKFSIKKDLISHEIIFAQGKMLFDFKDITININKI